MEAIQKNRPLRLWKLERHLFSNGDVDPSPTQLTIILGGRNLVLVPHTRAYIAGCRVAVAGHITWRGLLGTPTCTIPIGVPVLARLPGTIILLSMNETIAARPEEQASAHSFGYCRPASRRVSLARPTFRHKAIPAPSSARMHSRVCLYNRANKQTRPLQMNK